MKIVEKKCAACGSPIYVYEKNVREEMYCTLHCMERATCGSIERLPGQIKTAC